MNRKEFFLLIIFVLSFAPIFSRTMVLSSERIDELETSLLSNDIPAVEDDFSENEIAIPEVLDTTNLSIEQITEIISFIDELETCQMEDDRYQIVLNKLHELYYLRFRIFISTMESADENTKTQMFRTLSKLNGVRIDDDRTARTGLAKLFLNQEIIFKLTEDPFERLELMAQILEDLEVLLTDFGLLPESRASEYEFQVGLMNRDVYNFFDLLRDNAIYGSSSLSSGSGLSVKEIAKITGIVVVGVAVIGGIVYLALRGRKARNAKKAGAKGSVPVDSGLEVAKSLAGIVTSQAERLEQQGVEVRELLGAVRSQNATIQAQSDARRAESFAAASASFRAQPAPQPEQSKSGRMGAAVKVGSVAALLTAGLALVTSQLTP